MEAGEFPIDHLSLMSTFDCSQPDFEEGLLCFDPFLDPLFRIQPTDFINDNCSYFSSEQNVEPPIPCVSDIGQESGNQQTQAEEIYYPNFLPFINPQILR